MVKKRVKDMTHLEFSMNQKRVCFLISCTQCKKYWIKNMDDNITIYKKKCQQSPQYLFNLGKTYAYYEIQNDKFMMYNHEYKIQKNFPQLDFFFLLLDISRMVITTLLNCSWPFWSTFECLFSWAISSFLYFFHVYYFLDFVSVIVYNFIISDDVTTRKNLFKSNEH